MKRKVSVLLLSGGLLLGCSSGAQTINSYFKEDIRGGKKDVDLIVGLKSDKGTFYSVYTKETGDKVQTSFLVSELNNKKETISYDLDRKHIGISKKTDSNNFIVVCQVDPKTGKGSGELNDDCTKKHLKKAKKLLKNYDEILADLDTPQEDILKHIDELAKKEIKK